MPIPMDTRNICSFELDKCAYIPQKKPVIIDVAVIFVQKRVAIDVPFDKKKEVVKSPIRQPTTMPVEIFFAICMSKGRLNTLKLGKKSNLY